MTDSTPRILGIDCYGPLTQELLNHAAIALGQVPDFCGRYFTSTTAGGAEYRHALENNVFASNNCLVLPIARQTNQVGGDVSRGIVDGKANGHDLLSTFGADYLASQGGRFRMFLDVEGCGLSQLTAKDYYVGWDQGLQQICDGTGVDILPCVYGIPGDGKTWAALRDAVVNHGARCFGTWLSHPWIAGTKPEPVQWTPSMLAPYVDSTALGYDDIMVHQYMFPRKDAPPLEQYDRSIVNPSLADASEFLSTLIKPQML